jgi:uncharacterized protein (TIGR03084 family)
VSLLETVLTDLDAETGRLDVLVADLPEDGWRTPTPAAGWDVATQVAHLAWTDQAALAAATDQAAWDALVLSAVEDPTGHVDRTALDGGAVAPAELLARWRAGRAALAAALVARAVAEGLPVAGGEVLARAEARLERDRGDRAVGLCAQQPLRPP